jgi:hypothetical protein
MAGIESNPHTGSIFNNFLENEGIEAEVSVNAVDCEFQIALVPRKISI